MKQSYIKNTLILSVCMLIGKVFGAIYRIPLSNILGTTGIGLYQMVFPVYSLFLVFITGGMPVYISQKVSYYRAKNDFESIEKTIKSCLLLCFFIASLFIILLIMLSKTLAIWQGNGDAYVGYITVAISIIFSAITCVYKGYFQGLENMTPSAICGVVEQVTKLIVGLCFSYFLKPYGVLYAVGGAFLGVLISEVVAFIYMYFTFKQKYKKFVMYKNKGRNNLGKTFAEFLPLSLGGLILPFSSVFDSFSVVNILNHTGLNVNISTSLFGIATGMINPLINFPILLCGTICTAILPTLSYRFAKGEEICEITSGTYFFVWFLSLPCVMGIIALAPNIIEVFFPAIEKMFTQVSIYYLCVSAFNIIWMSFNQISTSILNSFGKFKLPLISSIIGLIIKIIVLLTLLFATNLNILALCFAVNISNTISCFVNLYFVRKYTSIKIAFKNIFIPLFSSILMFIFIYFLNKLIIINEIVKTFILVLLGVILYLFLAFIFKVISYKKIKQLLFEKNN